MKHQSSKLSSNQRAPRLGYDFPPQCPFSPDSPRLVPDVCCARRSGAQVCDFGMSHVREDAAAADISSAGMGSPQWTARLGHCPRHADAAVPPPSL
eukprot:2315969-Pleurochrysis_carterae.AAC.1